jgi:glutaminyl-tRNA synthetase
VPASALRKFIKECGITKFDGVTDYAKFEHCIREELNATCDRFLGVIDPLEVEIINYPAEGIEDLEAINNPENPEAGSRKLAFGRTLYIDKADFMLEPVKGYFRLAPDKEVRLRYGYFIKCVDVVKDADGNVTKLLCTYDPETRGGNAPDGRKVKGTIHWVDAATAVPAEFRLYDRLFTVEQPGTDGIDFLTQMNPDSVKCVKGFVERGLEKAEAGKPFQLERQGYFTADLDSTAENPVFNRTASLKDSWAKKAK